MPTRSLQKKLLPLKFAALTPCFRREAGAAGTDTRGLLRVHQFDKVELVRITSPETGYSELEETLEHALAPVKLLGLPYRVIELCSGDLSLASAKTYDIELWAPGTGRWLEVSSVSCFGEYQARRMNLRCRGGGKGQVRHPYTINGSGLGAATPDRCDHGELPAGRRVNPIARIAGGEIGPGRDYRLRVKAGPSVACGSNSSSRTLKDPICRGSSNRLTASRSAS